MVNAFFYAVLLDENADDNIQMDSNLLKTMQSTILNQGLSYKISTEVSADSDLVNSDQEYIVENENETFNEKRNLSDEQVELKKKQKYKNTSRSMFLKMFIIM